MEHFVEQLIIRKSMLFRQLHDPKFGIAYFLINMHQAHLIDIPCKRHAHIFPEKTAEIFSAQIEMGGDAFQGDQLFVVKLNVFDDLRCV